MISDERLKQAVHEAAEALDRSLPDPETTALLSVTGDLPADELLALAETVRPVK